MEGKQEASADIPVFTCKWAKKEKCPFTVKAKNGTPEAKQAALLLIMRHQDDTHMTNRYKCNFCGKIFSRLRFTEKHQATECKEIDDASRSLILKKLTTRKSSKNPASKRKAAIIQQAKESNKIRDYD